MFQSCVSSQQTSQYSALHYVSVTTEMTLGDIEMILGLFTYSI